MRRKHISLSTRYQYLLTNFIMRCPTVSCYVNLQFLLALRKMTVCSFVQFEFSKCNYFLCIKKNSDKSVKINIIVGIVWRWKIYVIILGICNDYTIIAKYFQNQRTFKLVFIVHSFIYLFVLSNYYERLF